MPTKLSVPTDTSLDDRVRFILASRNLTLSQASQATEARFGRSSPFFFPHTLYYQLRLGSFGPGLHQVFALSHISGYRFSDWLRVFGLNLEDLPALQILLPSTRTTLLESSWADSQAWVPWLEERPGNTVVPPIAPLVQLLERSGPERLGSLVEGKRKSLYAKIGTKDALAFPDLLPGSIVRVNPIHTGDLLQANDATSERIFLVEHSKGFFCCRLRVVERQTIAPVSTQLPYAQVELEMSRQTRVLGVVDLEMRALSQPELAKVPKDLARYWKPQSLSQPDELGKWLRSTRVSKQISLRAAAATSRRVAEFFSDNRYLVSASSLCDYELLNMPPRDLHKSITVCLVYGLEFRTFLKVIGIALDKAGTEPMPDHFVSRTTPPERREDAASARPASGVFFDELLAQSGGVPFFLRNSIGSFSGLAEASLENCFWIGGNQDALYPYLAHGVLVLVNRRKKRPVHFISKPVWQQPVYMILKRDGTYVCACCSLENGTLIIHPYSPQFHRSERLRNHRDAEIIGQIVAVARKLT